MIAGYFAANSAGIALIERTWMPLPLVPSIGQ
jgi:hypothetical protein